MIQAAIIPPGGGRCRICTSRCSWHLWEIARGCASSYRTGVLKNPSTPFAPRRSRARIQLDIGSGRRQPLDFAQIHGHRHIEPDEPGPAPDEGDPPCFRLVTQDLNPGAPHVEELPQTASSQRIFPLETGTEPQLPRTEPPNRTSDEECHPLLLRYPFDSPNIPDAAARQDLAGPEEVSMPLPAMTAAETLDSPFTIADVDDEPVLPLPRRPTRRKTVFRSPRTIHTLRDLYGYYQIWLTVLAGFQLVTALQVSRVIRQGAHLEGNAALLTVMIFTIFVAVSLLFLHRYRGRDFQEFAVPLTMLSVIVAFISLFAKIHSLVNSG